jgi:hypothetical protein
MRDYGKIPCAFWTGRERRELSDDACLLLVYVKTSPHCNAIGCYRLPESYIAEDLRWDIARVTRALSETVSKQFLNRCETTFWVQIVGFFIDNTIANPNVGKHAAELVDMIPEECGLRDGILTELQQFAEKLPDWFRDKYGTVEKPFGKGFGTESNSSSKRENKNNLTAAGVDDRARASSKATGSADFDFNDFEKASLVCTKLFGVRLLTTEDTRVLMRWCKDYDMLRVLQLLEVKAEKYFRANNQPPAHPLKYFDAAVTENAAKNSAFARKTE